MISLFLPFIISSAIGSLDPMAVSDPTVSGSDFVVYDDIQLEKEVDFINESKSIVKSDPIENFVIGSPSKSAIYGYSNNDYIGYNYYTFNVSNGDSFTLLCDNFTFNRVFFNSNNNCFAFQFTSGNHTLIIDKGGSILSAQFYSNGILLANFPNFTYTDSTLVFTLVDSGVVTESSGGGDDPLPEDPDSPIVSGGDYGEILQSIDDRLNYFEDLFYYGSSIDDMGNGFKLIIVLIFLVTINIVLKIINWR